MASIFDELKNTLEYRDTMTIVKTVKTLIDEIEYLHAMVDKLIGSVLAAGVVPISNPAPMASPVVPQVQTAVVGANPVEPQSIVSAQVVAAPVVAAPVVAAPVVTAPAVAAPVVSTPVVATPVVATPTPQSIVPPVPPEATV
jgi:hypothetical protein